MLLAIDTATRSLSLALHDGECICAEMTWRTANRHTVELAPAIQRIIGLAGVKIASLTLLAVARGPGSFNGLRIGMSAAKGLAMARGLPLIAIPTLDITAAAIPPFEGLLIAVAEAGRGRVVAGDYRWLHGRWAAQEGVRIVSWQALMDAITEPTLIAGEIDGDGYALLARSEKPITVERRAFGLRRAGFLADLAWERWRSGDPGDPALVTPFYLHQPGVPHP